MKTSRNTNRQKNRKTKIFPRYMQEKLAITVLVVTLALFALVMVLYDLMTNKKDDFNQIVLSQQEYHTIPAGRYSGPQRNVSGDE